MRYEATPAEGGVLGGALEVQGNSLGNRGDGPHPALLLPGVEAALFTIDQEIHRYRGFVASIW